MVSKICKCKEDMVFVARWDDDQITDHCFNVYVCDHCGMILKNETCFRFNRWIDVDGNIHTYNKTKKTWKFIYNGT